MIARPRSCLNFKFTRAHRGSGLQLRHESFRCVCASAPEVPPYKHCDFISLAGSTAQSRPRRVFSNVFAYLVLAALLLLPLAARAQFHRAEQDRVISYWLLDPASHQFRISHDFTITRVGQKYAHSFVRKGSEVAPDSRMFDVDTGKELKTYTVKGKDVNALGYYPQPTDPDSVVVQGDLDRPIAEGQSVRVRVEETYTDPVGYTLDKDELVWKRTLGRPLNFVTLPAGWMLSSLDTPAVISLDDQGRVALRFTNTRNDQLNITLKARRRPAPPTNSPTTHNSFPKIRNWDSLRITLSRSYQVCAGLCPDYSVEIHGDGSVIYTFPSMSSRATARVHRSQISIDAVRELVNLFRIADYFSLRDNYSSSSKYNYTFITSIAFDEETKSVTDRLGLEAGMPQAVVNIEEAIDRIGGTDKLIGGPFAARWFQPSSPSKKNRVTPSTT